MCAAQIIAAVSHPSVVAKTIEHALTDEGLADRLVLHKVTGFLPTPKGSQTTLSVMQNERAGASAAAQFVATPRPEDTIRRLSDRFKEMHEDPKY